jgi:hypothetical protein
MKGPSQMTSRIDPFVYESYTLTYFNFMKKISNFTLWHVFGPAQHKVKLGYNLGYNGHIFWTQMNIFPHSLATHLL